MSKKSIQFSVSRQDLIFSYANSLEEMFVFGENGDDSLSEDPGVRAQEALGYDFQHECRPIIQIKPIASDLTELVGHSPEEFDIHITLEDIGLNVRKHIYQEGLTSIIALKTIKLDLSEYSDLAFFNGFIVRCFVTPSETKGSESGLLWSRSQVVFSKEFIVRASSDDALFNINWTTFNNDDEKRDLLMFVEWASTEVSNSADIECFSVLANMDLMSPFKRLENNSHFGHFAIRLIYADILADLMTTCLMHCDESADPVEGSLHAKLRPIFEKHNLNLEEMAEDIKSSNSMDALDTRTTVIKIAQQEALIGSHLNDLKFGGYR